MSDSEWVKVDYDQFISDFGNKLIVKYAPSILYSKKDKEHEALISLITFFFITGGLLIYIAVTYFLAPILFSLLLFVIIVAIGAISAFLLMINYLKSNVYIKPLECWFEIFRGNTEERSHFYCFSYFPIFSGLCHPNEVKNIVYKIYKEEVLDNKFDVSHIEVYLKLFPINKDNPENLGYFFQYAEGHPFKMENIEKTPWKFFPFEKSNNENFLATANWAHQYEWKDDLEYDFDKLHEYAPWVIQRWNSTNLKPLTEVYKTRINWGLRNIESIPKIKPWEKELEKQSYDDPREYEALRIVDEVIKKFLGTDEDLQKVRKLKGKLFSIKSFFRDLKNEKN